MFATGNRGRFGVCQWGLPLCLPLGVGWFATGPRGMPGVANVGGGRDVRTTQASRKWPPSQKKHRNQTCSARGVFLNHRAGDPLRTRPGCLSSSCSHPRSGNHPRSVSHPRSGATSLEEASQLNLPSERCFLKASGWQSIRNMTRLPFQKPPSQKKPCL